MRRIRNRIATHDYSKGFTLLEILVVMFIIATIFAVAIPQFQDIFETRLKSSMRRIAGAVKFCFNEAIIKQATVRLNFNLATGEYWHSILMTNEGGSVGEFIEMPSNVQEHQILPDGIFFQDVLTARSSEKTETGETFVLFYSTGYAEKAVIHLRDLHGRQYTLLVKPLTGGMETFEGYIDFAEMQQQQSPFGSSDSTMGLPGVTGGSN